MISGASDEPQIVFECGDALSILKTYSKRRFDLIMTSPPYNTGKEYEVKKPLQEYLAEQKSTIKQLASLMSDKGSLCWQVGNYVDEATREVYPLDVYYYHMFKKVGLKLRNRIVWHFGHGLHASSRFSGRYETILWFTKSDKDYIFNLDQVRIPSKYPGKRHYKGPKKGELSGNPKGKNPSDAWSIVIKDWEQEWWDIPNVKSNHPEKTLHPCQYPIELVERCVLALTNEGSWVLDPFAGVGTTLLAAFLHGRNAVGIEAQQQYLDVAKERLKMLVDGTLPRRPLEQQIYDHTKSKLSMTPNEFTVNENR